MKKIGAMLFIGIFSLMTFWGTASAGPSVDQSNTKIEDASASLLMDAPYYRAQTFRPDRQHIDQIDIYLKDRAEGSWAQIYLYNETNHLEIANVGHRMAAGTGWETYPLNVDVTVGARYRIKLVVNASGVKWPFTTGNVYIRGSLYYEENTYYSGADFIFRTWGTDPVEMVEEQIIPEDGTDEPGTPGTPASIPGTAEGITVVAETPTATVATSIAKPTELTAAYTDSAKLTWKASTTTDITGYIVFRSETKGKGYTKIADVAKNILEYTDTTAAASKTYYYVVRAVKGTVQSASSNEATVVVPATAPPIAPQNLKVNLVQSSSINVTWDKNPEENISGYTCTISLEGKEVEVKNIGADDNNCLFSNLIPDADYKIAVIAKNSLGESSSPSEITQKTALETVVQKEPILPLLLWVLLSFAAALTIVLMIMICRRHKKAKQQSV